ncbi:MAG: M56 family metallopeptidase [Ornithinimicrobium sp.]
MQTAAVVLLCLSAPVFAVLAPRLMATLSLLRRCPGPALLAWQSVALAGVSAALLAAPVAAWAVGGQHIGLLLAAATLSTAMLVRLLISGHRVGTSLRALRRRHREWVDLLAGDDDATGAKILAHPGPTAYCIPGDSRHVVLSQGTLHALRPDELEAVLAHERAHLQARHDLVLEFFSVLHYAVPRGVRCEAALTEVRLLVEALADRAALRQTGARPLARALVRMHAAPGAPRTPHAEELGVVTGAEQARVRLLLIADAATPRRGQALAMLACALTALITPFLLAGLGV